MKKVTKNNIIKYVKMKQEYEKNKDEKLLSEINNFTEQVINKDKHYYSKISSYNLDDTYTKYCL